MRSLGAVVGATLLLVLAACASGPQDGGLQPSDPDAAKDNALRGRTFVSTGVTVDGEPRPLVGGTAAVVGFTDEGLTLHAGCNQMSAPAAYADGHLTVEGMGGTEMGCEPPLMDQDAWLARFLADDPRYALDGDTLRLTGAGTAITLEPQAEQTDAELTGTRWRLAGIVDGAGADGSVGSIPAGVRSDLRIVDDSLALHTGCNSAGGSVHVSGATLVVRLLESTDAGCRPSAAPVQEAVLEVLQGTVTYAVDGQGLTLTRGDRGLVFRAD